MYFFYPGRSLKLLLAACVMAGVQVGAPALAQTPPAKPAAAAPAKPAAAPVKPAVPAPTKPPSEEARKEARALGDRLNFPAQTQNLLIQIRNQIALGFAQANQKPPLEMAKVVDEVLMPDFAGQSLEITTAIVDAWASAFTVDELKQLHTFLSSPLGNKFLKEQGPIAQQWQAYANPWTQKVLAQTMAAHATELAARGIANNPFKPKPTP